MLAQMLAQTPKTAPSVPTSVANAIVSQLPQERLPKNLEKKLVHTPYTGAPTSGTSSICNSQYSFSPVPGGARSLLSTSLQQEIVTSDSRAHVTLAPQNNVNYNQTNFLGKMLPPGETGPNLQNYGAPFMSNSSSQQSLQSSNVLFDGITDGNSDSNNEVSTSDPLLSDILEQVNNTN